MAKRLQINFDVTPELRKGLDKRFAGTFVFTWGECFRHVARQLVAMDDEETKAFIKEAKIADLEEKMSQIK